MSAEGSSYCYVVVLPKPLLLLVRIVDRVWLAVAGALAVAGLRRTPPPATLLGPSWEHVLAFSPAPPSDHPAPLPSPSDVKAKLPAVVVSGAGDGECAVCLRLVVEGEGTRRLGNCRHAFHVDCIDGWMDVGGLTCPVCRCPLLPSGILVGHKV